MRTNSLFEIATIYEHTAIILGIGSLIMGATLLTLRRTLKNSGTHSKSGLSFLAMALFALGVINIVEYIVGVDSLQERYSLSVAIFSASVELFLIYTAFMSMISKGFVTRRRICFELVCIVLFTTPALFVSPDNFPVLYYVFFAVGLIFYSVKLVCNYLFCNRLMEKIRVKTKDVLSDDDNLWFNWIINTFHVVLAIGIISVIAPMTNLMGLVFYNSILFFFFFYIYISVIKNISIFDSCMTILEDDESRNVDRVDESTLLLDVCEKPTIGFMVSRQKVYDDWISARGYAEVSITATEVARQLKTNRTRLSHYLRDELNTTYYEWIAVMRIEDAKRQLIQYPDRSIYEIALSVGIEDRDNFRRVFQRCVGVSPTAYRKEKLGL